MNKLNWENKEAIKHYQFFIKDFGNPTSVAKERDGMALWTSKNMNSKYLGDKNIFYEHLIRDESVQHNCPAKHYDFIYSYLSLYIPPKKLAPVLSLSGSVGYDALKKVVSARCGSVEANIATLKIILDILLNEETTVKIDGEEYIYQGIKEIQQKNIYGMTINQTKDKNFVKELYETLVKNYEKYVDKTKNIAPTGYWTAAFNYTNGECLPPNKENKICQVDIEGGRKSIKRNSNKSTNKPNKKKRSTKQSVGKRQTKNKPSRKKSTKKRQTKNKPSRKKSTKKRQTKNKSTKRSSKKMM